MTKKFLHSTVMVILFIGAVASARQASAFETWPPLNIQVSNDRIDGIYFSWDDNPEVPDQEEVIQYRRVGTTTFLKLTNIPGGGPNEYLWTEAAPGLNYEFKFGYCGASSWHCDEPWPYLADSTIYPGSRKLETPSSFNASYGTKGDGIHLSWAPHPSQGEPGFHVQISASLSNGGPFAIIGSTAASYWVDTSWDPLQIVYYKLTACIETCSDPAYDVGRRGLETPTNLSAATSIPGVDLDWDPVTGADGYEVERSLPDPIAFSLLGSPTASAFLDTTGDLNVEYVYRVRACSSSASICSGYKSVVGMRGIHAPFLTAEPATGGIQLAWTHDQPGETTEYRIWRAPTIFPLLRDLIAVQDAGAGLEYLDLGAAIDTDYLYDVKACSNAGTLVCGELSNVAEAVWHDCHQLTIGVEGSGATPVPDPTQSIGCPPGSYSYTEGELVELLGAAADPGWELGYWSGTFDSTSNVVVFPASDQAVTVTYVQSGWVFSDDFETGNTDRWASAVAASSSWFYPCGQAVVDGSRCVCRDLGARGDHEDLGDGSSVKRTNLAVRFSFNMDELSVSEGEVVPFVEATMGPVHPFVVVLERRGGRSSIQLEALSDDRKMTGTSWLPVMDGPHTLEIRWRAASGPGANDGYCELYIDDAFAAATPWLDNDTMLVDPAEVGLSRRMLDRIGSGTFYVDAGGTGFSWQIGLP